MKALLLALLLAPLLCFAQSTKELDTKNGFRDLKFGSPIEQLQGATLLKEKGQQKTYSRSTDALKVGEAVLSGIYYTYYKGRLLSVRLVCPDADNGRTMMDAFVMQYGPGHQSNKYIEDYGWSGQIVTMVYIQNVAGRSILEMESKSIADELLADHFKEAEKAKNDL